MNLKKRIEELERELKETKESLAKALKRIEELEGKLKENSKPSFIKEETIYHHKSGQKEDHKGYSRHIPERIDEIKELNITKCPYCKGKLSKTQEIRERIITEIEVKTINTKYIIHRKYCRKCKRIVEPTIKEALPNARFGLKLMLLILILKLDSRIPSNKITSIIGSIFQVRLSDGEIYSILKQLSKAFGPYYKEIVIKIRKTLVKHIDETSWRINGKNHWLWLFINKEAALYIVRKHRSSKVPIKILGNQEGKIIVNDRFEAYNKLAEKTSCLQQICWAHLLRNSKDLAGYYEEAKYIHKRLKQIYRKAKEVSKEKLLHWIDLIAIRRYSHSQVRKFVKSVCIKHKEDLFRFVDNPNVEPTNNLAERGLRHAVIIRKISNGSRSEKGAEITGRLLSVMQTMKLQNTDIMSGMSNLLHNTK